MHRKLFFLVSVIVCFSSFLQAQKKWVIPTQPADVMVFEIKDGNNKVWEQVQTYGIAPYEKYQLPGDWHKTDLNRDNDTCILYMSGLGFEEYCGYAVLCHVLPEGIIEHMRAKTYPSHGEWEKVQYYPSSPPPGDTITLYSWLGERYGSIIDTTRRLSFARTLRTFDSTIFGLQRECFTADIRRPESRDTFTIANGLGLIRAVVHISDGKRYDARLKKAVFSGVRYNWHSRYINILPICKGDVRQYKNTLKWYSPTQLEIREGKSEIRTDRDTIINGNTYYFLPIKAESWDVKCEWLRNTDRGTVAFRPPNGDVLIFPSYIAPGMVIDGAEYLDTSTVLLFGQRILTGGRSTIFNAFNGCFYIGDGPGAGDTWADGLGFIRSGYEDFWGGGGIHTDTLRYASICGTETGTPLEVQAVRADATSFNILLQNYPNPISREQSVASIPFIVEGPLPEYVSLVVTDVLGRMVSCLVDGFQQPGKHTASFSSTGVLPGPYFYTLRVKGNMVTKKMQVE